MPLLSWGGGRTLRGMERFAGRFEILSALGRGGMGEVHLARDLQAGKGSGPVALKRFIVQPGADDVALARMQREADLGAKIAHPALVRVLDASIGGPAGSWISMEYVRGESARTLSRRLGALPESLCRHVALQCLAALEALHAAGVVHRDVKPSNLMIDEHEQVKLADLGIARVARRDEDPPMTTEGEFVGTWHYASPEQLDPRCTDLDGRSDLYSLGATLFELAFGESWFQRRVAHEASGGPIDLTQTLWHAGLPEEETAVGAPALSPPFLAFLETLLAARPHGRFQSAREAADALRTGSSGAWFQRWRASSGRRPGLGHRSVLPGASGPFVGRDDELAAVLSRVERLAHGDGATVLVEGDVGMGKSRLMHEVFLRLTDAPVAPALVHSRYGQDEGPFDALCAGLRDAFGESLLQDVASVALGADSPLCRCVGALLDGVSGHTQGVDLPVEGLRSGLTRVVAELARRQPLVVLLEDLHAGGADARTQFLALSVALSQLSGVVLGTTRPGAPADWIAEFARVPRTHVLHLAPLDEGALRVLLKAVPGDAVLQPALQREILVRSEGNPYFLQELARVGRQPAGASTQRLTADGPTTGARIQIPTTLRALARARIVQVSEEDRELLELAALLGQSFEPYALHAGLRAANGARELPYLQTLKRLSALARGVRTHRLR